MGAPCSNMGSIALLLSIQRLFVPSGGVKLWDCQAGSLSWLEIALHVAS